MTCFEQQDLIRPCDACHPWGHCGTLSPIFSLCHEESMSQVQVASSTSVPQWRGPTGHGCSWPRTKMSHEQKNRHLLLDAPGILKSVCYTATRGCDMRKDRHLRAKERGLARAQPCLHPRLLGSGTERNERVLWKPPTRPLERRGGAWGGGQGRQQRQPRPCRRPKGAASCKGVSARL